MRRVARKGTSAIYSGNRKDEHTANLRDGMSSMIGGTLTRELRIPIRKAFLVFPLIASIWHIRFACPCRLTLTAGADLVTRPMKGFFVKVILNLQFCFICTVLFRTTRISRALSCSEQVCSHTATTRKNWRRAGVAWPGILGENCRLFPNVCHTRYALFFVAAENVLRAVLRGEGTLSPSAHFWLRL